jgi:tetratricopeptide (TPR) repeat protein
MRVGERARFVVPAELAYGSEGHFSFPAVRKNQALVLDIELLGVRGGRVGDDETAQADMTYERRMVEVRAHRAAGNAAFTSGDTDGAIRAYSMALTYLVEDFMMQLFDAYEEEANAEYVATHGNLAAARLKKGEYVAALKHVDFVLKIDKDNDKAHYRRGICRMALGQEDAAREALLKAKHLTEARDGGKADVNVIRALRQLDETRKARENASAALFQGLFQDQRQDQLQEEPPNQQSSKRSSGGFFSRMFGR